MNIKASIILLTVGLSVAEVLHANPVKLDREDVKSEAEHVRRERARQRETEVQVMADMPTEPNSPKWHIKTAARYYAHALGFVAEGQAQIARTMALQAVKQLDLAEKRFSSSAPELAVIAQMREAIFVDVFGLTEAEFKAASKASGRSSSALAESSE